MPEIKKGDVVRLKSGGPAMTVEDIGNYSPNGPENGAACIWFEKTKKHSDVFDLAVLELSKPLRAGVVHLGGRD